MPAWRIVSEGRAACPNNLTLPAGDVERAVLDALADALLHPTVLDEAIRRAAAQLATARRGDPDVAGALRARLTELDAERGRLTLAIASGGELPALLAALRSREEERRGVVAAPDEISRQVTGRACDEGRLRRDLRSKLGAWRRLLRRHAVQAHALVRTLIVGRLEFTPDLERKSYAFRGQGTVRPLLAGVVPQNSASPTGMPPCNGRGTVGRAAAA